ncbi:nitrilase-related carbon-nitrogen hydrolase [endosymbiont 'TC1' of Trimyema compressum]|uniref:nitrilase-related carbon-nitrogen hydrolase n=1 Tax=endosymbiont 'TC1' of Trimyema compressum TaxID=243899 RepID=UPI000B4DC086|nr:nitrilase-related carbon-nitrogen hydrolase [endosymbiont 'TC1' of Trimyema compressum]
MIERYQNSMINLALCQFQTAGDKQLNLQKAKAFIQMAKDKEANIIALPEMFNCPYEGISFRKFAELEGEETFKLLEEMSKDIVLIGGYIPEKDKEGFCYNTSYIFENGKLIGKHRKIHLFNIDFNNIKMHESDYLKPGQETTVVNTSFGPIGIAICFDIRFPEIFLEMNKKEPFLYVIPSTFNKVTGPAHFKLLGRSRAVDFQSFCSFNLHSF